MGASQRQKTETSHEESHQLLRGNHASLLPGLSYRRTAPGLGLAGWKLSSPGLAGALAQARLHPLALRRAQLAPALQLVEEALALVRAHLAHVLERLAHV